MDGLISYILAKNLIGRSLMGISTIKLDTTTNKHWVVTTTAGDTFRVAIPNSVSNPDLLNKFTVDSEGNLLFDGKPIGGEGGDAKLTKDITANVSAGAIGVNTKLAKDLDFTSFVEKLLCKDESPAVNVVVTCSDSKSYDVVRERGVGIDVTAKATVTKKSYDIKSGSWTTPSTIVETVSTTGGTYTRSFTNISDTATFTFKAVDTKNLTGSNAKKITFVDPMYCSLVNLNIDTANITADDVTNGTKLLKVKGTFDYVVTANAEKVVWAIPKSYGNLASIKDTKNGLELITGYETVEINITTVDGTSVPYIVYVPVLESTITDFNYRLSW